MSKSNRFRRMRQKAGLTQEQIAERMGITQSAVARLESGKHKPRARTIAEFRRVCRSA